MNGANREEGLGASLCGVAGATVPRRAQAPVVLLPSFGIRPRAEERRRSRVKAKERARRRNRRDAPHARLYCRSSPWTTRSCGAPLCSTTRPTADASARKKKPNVRAVFDISGYTPSPGPRARRAAWVTFPPHTRRVRIRRRACRPPITDIAMPMPPGRASFSVLWRNDWSRAPALRPTWPSAGRGDRGSILFLFKNKRRTSLSAQN